ncbi:MAG TPA: hypothetical protein VFU10_02645 [Gaiellaceae bacterium]|nr:hypothetical protein [Gaiellaceae bacterium]
MLLVGGLFVVSAALIYAWRAKEDGDEAKIRRFAYLTLFFVVLPAFFAMRIGAEWVLSASPFSDNANWVGIGFAISDAGFVVLIISLILAGFGIRRMRTGGGQTGARVITVLSVALLIAYVVAIWAMTTKPS